LYNDEEIDILRSLIQSAKTNNVNFVYSISPGIDIIYSRATEVKAIIRKLKQVEELGCRSFALLFDDIEVILMHFINQHLIITNFRSQ
jgi:protein O-GlcNAcase/histone acetyltransferase